MTTSAPFFSQDWAPDEGWVKNDAQPAGDALAAILGGPTTREEIAAVKRAFLKGGLP